jgi:hypothetical protein
MSEWIPHIISLAAGTLLGWLLSDLYYRRSKRDLEQYMARTDVMITDAVRQGLFDIERDKSGRISGIRIPAAPTNVHVE